jgi:lauroyl/myristoyl acyltransferase
VRTKKRIKRAGEVTLIASLSAFAKALPANTGRELFAQLGATAARFAKRDGERAAANLGIAFPDAPEPVRRAMVSAMFRQLGRNAFEFMRLEGASPDAVKARVSRVEGMENFLGPLQARQGCHRRHRDTSGAGSSCRRTSWRWGIRLRWWGGG